MMWRALVRAAACGVGFALAAPAARAADYPVRPVTIVVPFTAGGPTDVLARLIGRPMSAVLGQQMIVENIGGAAGTIGAARVARSDPDGYTLFLHNVSHATAPALYRSLSYDPVADFEPIGLVADVPQAVVSRNGIPAKTFPELIAYLKTNHAKVNLAQAGRGSGSHLCALLLMSAIGVDLTQIAYKGTGPAVTDLMGGQVDVMCDQVSNTGPQIKAGTIRGYCVTSEEPVASLPDLPTCASAGLPGFRAGVWNALYAPKGTPKPVVDKLAAALRSALHDREVRTRLADLGAVPASDADADPAALGAFLRQEVAKWAGIIKAAGLKPE